MRIEDDRSLGETYVEEVLSEITKLDVLINAPQRPLTDEAGRAEARAVIHRIKGASGMVGHTEAYQKAVWIEEMLSQIKAPRPTTGALDDLRSELRDLYHLIEDYNRNPIDVLGEILSNPDSKEGSDQTFHSNRPGAR